MNALASPTASPLLETARWLAAHARFPQSRLEPRAELMVCVSVLAAREVAEARHPRHPLDRRLGGQAAAQRIHALRRAQVHFKCDNSAKV